MAEIAFDHDRLDVYRLAIQYTAESFLILKGKPQRIVSMLTRMTMKFRGDAVPMQQWKDEAESEDLS